MYFFFNVSPTTEIYTLSLHDALPICRPAWLSTRPPVTRRARWSMRCLRIAGRASPGLAGCADRKSTRLNYSHPSISYAVFCLKKKSIYKIDESDTDKLTKILKDSRMI